jgi:hypothetical protein
MNGFGHKNNRCSNGHFYFNNAIFHSILLLKMAASGMSQQFAIISYGEQSAFLIGGILIEILKYFPGFRSEQT